MFGTILVNLLFFSFFVLLYDKLAHSCVPTMVGANYYLLCGGLLAILISQSVASWSL